MSEQERIMVGLDIGTTKICAVVASVEENNRINILGVGKADSEGLNRGVVVNINKTVDAIRSAIQQAEMASGIEVNSAIVGIAGDHIRSQRSTAIATINNEDRIITQQEINRLIESGKNIAIPDGHQILHVIPQSYAVDDQDGIADPIGMSGLRVEAEFQIITGMVTAVTNIYKCVEQAGYQVTDIILEPIASSYATLESEEMEAGVVLIDIGGGTTDVAIFKGNTIRHTAVIGIAGQTLTNDIQIGLKILKDQAEKIKLRYGDSFVDMIEDDQTITIPGIAGRPAKELTKSILAEIIQPRMEELLEIANLEVQRSGFSNTLAAGAVLTGGGALISNLNHLASHILGMDIKIGVPQGITGGLINEVNSPIYATSVGLVIYALKHTDQDSNVSWSPKDSDNDDSFITKVINRMKAWFKEF